MFYAAMTDDLTTLGELQQAGRYVSAFCRACRREAQLHPRALIRKLGPQVRVSWAGSALKCSRCGSKNVTAQPGERPRHPAKYPQEGR